MQVISAYLVKQIVETDSPTPSGNRFVPKATVIEWLDDVSGSYFSARWSKFEEHLGLVLDGTPEIGWSANQITYQGATVTCKKEMRLTSLRFLNSSAPWYLFLTSDSDYAPVGDWNNDANSCSKWVVLHDGAVAPGFYRGSYAYNTYVNGEKIDSGNSETSGDGVPSADYESENASSSPPYAGCSVKEISCFFNAVGFDNWNAGYAFARAMYNYCDSPTPENKQAVINSLENSLNP